MRSPRYSPRYSAQFDSPSGLANAMLGVCLWTAGLPFEAMSEGFGLESASTARIAEDLSAWLVRRAPVILPLGIAWLITLREAHARHWLIGLVPAVVYSASYMALVMLAAAT